MVIIDAPEKRRHHYVCNIRNHRNKPIVLQNEDAKIIRVNELEEGYSLDICLQSDMVEKIRSIEQTILSSVIDNHKKWFKTDMSNDKIKEYFYSCLSDNIVTVHVSNYKPPYIQWLNAQIDITDMYLKPHRDLKASTCKCTIEASGIYFYPKRFGMKFALRSLQTYDTSREEYIEDDENTDKMLVESEWKHEIDDFIDLLDRDIQRLHEKVQTITNIKSEINAMFLTATKEATCTNEWNQLLESLRSIIFRYKTGCLS